MGAVVLLAVQPLLAMPRLRVPAATVVLLLCAAGQVATIYPDWGRMPRPLPVAVRVPTLPSDSLVVLLDRSPTAYLAIYVRPSVRFVGANSNLIQPGRGARLAQQAEAAIRAHRGPLFGLEDAAAFPRAAGVTLSYYGLRRDHCTQVESNLDSNAIRLCRLLPREN